MLVDTIMTEDIFEQDELLMSPFDDEGGDLGELDDDLPLGRDDYEDDYEEEDDLPYEEDDSESYNEYDDDDEEAQDYDGFIDVDGDGYEYEDEDGDDDDDYL